MNETPSLSPSHPADAPESDARDEQHAAPSATSDEHTASHTETPASESSPTVTPAEKKPVATPSPMTPFRFPATPPPLPTFGAPQSPPRLAQPPTRAPEQAAAPPSPPATQPAPEQPPSGQQAAAPPAPEAPMYAPPPSQPAPPPAPEQYAYPPRLPAPQPAPPGGMTEPPRPYEGGRYVPPPPIPPSGPTISAREWAPSNVVTAPALQATTAPVQRSSPLNAALLGAIAVLLLVLAVFQGINTFRPRSVAPTGVQDVRVQQRQLKPETVSEVKDTIDKAQQALNQFNQNAQQAYSSATNDTQRAAVLLQLSLYLQQIIAQQNNDLLLIYQDLNSTP